jgi:Cd2+/Zn2+-exporting ATPase
MDCGNCAATIENSMASLPGVEGVQVSFTTETMELAGTVDMASVEKRLRELGYRIASDDANAPRVSALQGGFRGFLDFLWSRVPLRLALLVAIGVIPAIVFLPGAPPIGGFSALDVAFAAAVVLAGAPIFIKGFRALIFARRITIDLLMAIASIGALGIGATGEAVTVVLLFMLGEALEAFSAERARDSLRELMNLQPQEAVVLQSHGGAHDHDGEGDGHGETRHADEHHASHASHDHHVTLPVAEIAVGDRVLVRPGQRIPMDGTIVEGVSSVNESPVTGENMPVVRKVGDAVLSGTVNGEAALTIRVSRVAEEGTIARIARLVEQAQAQRSPAERFIDRFARWYTPAVVAVALLVVLVPVVLLGQPLLGADAGARGWLYRGLALLIIACPCALVISIPVTVVSGLTRLASLGVLVKGGAQLDRLADVEVVAFDKTGTLTHGRPSITSMRASDCDHPSEVEEACTSCDDLVAVAASVERSSEHPVAHAIVAAAEQRPNISAIEAAADVTAHPGEGVSGQLRSGSVVAVGAGALVHDQMPGWSEIDDHADRARDDGHTVMYVAQDDKVVGYIGVQDEIRATTRETLDELDSMEPRVRKVVLTGDNEAAAKRVAAEVGGLDEIHASMLPAEKLRAIEDLRKRWGCVAMVGDGINDAPALARSDVGIAMGGAGTALAMETADVVLMQDDLSHVPLALRMARRSREVIKQNIVLSLGLKVAFLALAIPGLATLWMAVLADVGATLLVTLNGMRLLRQS